MKMANQQPEKNSWKSGFRFWSGLPFIIVRRIIVILLTGIFIFLLIQLEVDNNILRQEINRLRTIPQGNSCENDSCRMKIGELAKRIARTEFILENPAGFGLLDVENALQMAVKVVELPPGAQPYQLEDAIYITDASQQNPAFPKGPAWQFTLSVQKGQFIVEVSAATWEIIFVNEIR